MATGPVKNGTPKPCKHCGSIFTPTTRSQRYCVDCKDKLNCVMCGKSLNIHFNRIGKAGKRRKCASCYKATASEHAPRGSQNAAWKGGRHRTPAGYMMIRMPGHPRAGKHGYVYEHIVIAENKYRRSLKGDEVVHHKNKVKDDNRSSNLVVMYKTAHDQLHKRDREIAQYGK